ncbi:helix-turn-helix domain-containing protein [Streptomyces noursei]|uniref:helix-turn-helix domain-containing protein n=1 Tax=Streptomyces noursei TaxID=1971 RepID=UPI001963A5FA|nr:helix-turn-helix domain-containing protein [Streptomyces noursei]QRX95771.1 hypothetical protein JNO44_37760 [Streptomyces noursei]
MTDTNTTPTPQPTPTTEPMAVPLGLTGAAATVYTELMGLTEPVTVSELARAASVGHSTAGRWLTSLEKHGLAARTPGGHDGPRRMPDLWYPATPTPAPTNTSEPDDTATQPQSGTTPDDPAKHADSTTEDAGNTHEENPSATATTPEPDNAPPTTDGEPGTSQGDSADEAPAPSPATEPEETAPAIGQEPSTRQTEPPQDTENSGDEGDGDQNDERNAHGEGDTTTTGAKHATEPQTTPAVPASPMNGRLVPGALRQMVIDHLQAYPDEAFTATRISRVIEKSSGAIANALTKLVGLGIAEQVTDQPRTFRLARPTTPDTTP